MGNKFNSNKVVGFESVGDIFKRIHPELLVSKQKLRQAEVVEMVRLKREAVTPNIGFASRPFVLCGLPIKRPPKGLCSTNAGMVNFYCR